jgi:hypothetical protein
MSPLPLSLLKIACVGTFIVGLVAAAAAHPALAAPWALLMDLVQWPIDGAQGIAASEARILSAIGGGLTCGWAVMLSGLAAGPLARGDRDIRGLFVVSVLTWFTVDSLASFAAGWAGNVVLNMVFAALLLVPFLLDRSPSARTAAA